MKHSRQHPAQQKKAHQIALSAKEFPHHPKSLSWYIGISILLLGLLAGTLKYQQYLLAAVVVAFAVAIFSTAKIKPGHKEIRLTGNGIDWGGQFYGYHHFKAFWLAKSGSQTTLYLERLNWQPLLSFVVTEAQAEELIGYLTNFLPWHDHKTEPLPDQINRLLRF